MPTSSLNLLRLAHDYRLMATTRSSDGGMWNHMKKLPVSKIGQVWMVSPSHIESAPRMLAIQALHAMRLDPNDFRLRDDVITAIDGPLEGMLNHVAGNSEKLLAIAKAVADMESRWSKTFRGTTTNSAIKKLKDALAEARKAGIEI